MGKFYQQMFRCRDGCNERLLFFLFLWWQHRSYLALTFEVHGLFKSTHKWNFTIATSATEGRCLPDPVAWESALEQPAEATCGKRLDRLGLSGFLQSTLSESVEVLSPVQFAAFTVSLLTFFKKGPQRLNCLGKRLIKSFHLATPFIISRRLSHWSAVIDHVALIEVKGCHCCPVSYPNSSACFTGKAWLKRTGSSILHLSDAPWSAVVLCQSL